MPQDHQQSADAEQDHPGEKLLTVDFAREFVHVYPLKTFTESLQSLNPMRIILKHFRTIHFPILKEKPH